MIRKFTAHLGCVSLLALVSTLPARADDRADAAASTSADAPSDIIVTGTRQTGISAADSAAPIQVLSSDQLSHVGQPNLIQALNQIVPSFTAEGFGGDASQLTLTARLRGLSPNHTLVLVNGKRRHPTANLQASQGPFQGGASPDLDLIPSEAIERIEVLQDGAAAQYGSDAIAGVINIILKSDRSGGSASLTAGQYYAGDGTTLGASGRLAVPLGENGHFDLTLFHRYHDSSQRGGGDTRISNSDGSPKAGTPASWASIPGFPNLNAIFGDARSHLTTGFYDAGYDVGGAEVYSFGSYGWRTVQAAENYRVPTRISRTVGGVTTYPFPNGFTPYLGIEEEDYSFTGGIKGEVSEWRWDISGTYGRDAIDISTLNTANASLYVDTGYTPRDIYDGQFISTQFTGNLDISRGINIGLAKPLNFAFGGEYRRDTYEIRPGDSASIYKEGGQSFPGFQPTDAGKHSRNSVAAYIDISVNPVTAWTVDVAGRFEHYNDFGDTTIGKLTTRYDFSPAFAVRGTASTGFRAPTLAEAYYSATQVSPTQAVVQLPANSPSSALLGFQPLRPEKSTNFSLGVVARPVRNVTITLDAYQIRVENRIISTGNILGKNGTVIVNQQVLDAITQHGNIIDPTASYVSASTFANAIDTRTRGVELAATATTNFDFGKVDWSLTGNYNKTKITRDRLAPGLLTIAARSNIETASPEYKIGLGALFTHGPLSLNLRETIYGPASVYASPDSATYYETRLGTAAITDIELGYRFGSGLHIAVGANNLFDKRPPAAPLTPDGSQYVTGNVVWNAPLLFGSYGINGGYYYGRISVDF